MADGFQNFEGAIHLMSSFVDGWLDRIFVASNQTWSPGVKLSLILFPCPRVSIMWLYSSSAALASSRTLVNSSVKEFVEGLDVSEIRFPFHGWVPYVKKNGVSFLAERTLSLYWNSAVGSHVD